MQRVIVIAAFSTFLNAHASPAAGSTVTRTALPPPQTGPATTPFFEDATKELGLDKLGGSAAAWSDYNRDGWVDLLSAGALWHNREGKGFVRTNDLPGDAVWGDIDNDGWPDVYSWGNGQLWRNNQGTGFENVTQRMPGRGEHVSRGAAWGDFNKDGFIDIYLGGYEVWNPARDYADAIYLNQEGKAFTEHWRQPAKPYRARGICVADYDEDGDIDVYVSNYRLQPNLLWQNNGKGVFSDQAKATGTDGDGDLGAWGHTIGSAWGDLDNDGHLDLFVGNFSHSPAYQDRPKFLQNLGADGGWKFKDHTAGAGLKWQESFASPTLGDFDNDGDLDLYFTTVYGGDHCVLYSNEGDWKFEDRTTESGINTKTTYQGAWADFDGDGDLDLVSGGRLWRNRGNPGNRIIVRLVGRGAGGKDAIGAQVRVQRGGGHVLTRQVSGVTGEGNQNSPDCHFGLGNEAGPVQFEVRWPDGTAETFKGPANHRFTIRR